MTEPTGYFDRKFQADNDPWRYRQSWYEQRKRAITLAALPHRRYQAGFEPGCANGELSLELAGRCERLLCSDVSDTAVALARKRLSAHSWVTVEHRRVPEQWPKGLFDLLVISEMAYYLDRAGLAALIEHVCRSLTPEGTLVVCHWQYDIEPWALRASEVHQCFAAVPGLNRLSTHAEKDFLLEVYSPDGRSVAAREGLV